MLYVEDTLWSFCKEVIFLYRIVAIVSNQKIIDCMVHSVYKKFIYNLRNGQNSFYKNFY